MLDQGERRELEDFQGEMGVEETEGFGGVAERPGKGKGFIPSATVGSGLSLALL